MSRHQASLHEGRPVTESDKNAGEAAKKLHDLLQKISIAYLNSEAENKVHAMIILSQAAASILHLLARAVMREEDEEAPIHSTATLFAALMAYQTAPCEVERGTVRAEFSPLVIFDTLKDIEKLTGQRPDDRLDPMMCETSRCCAANPAIVAQIGRERTVLERAGRTLN